MKKSLLISMLVIAAASQAMAWGQGPTYGNGGYLVPGDSHNLNPYEPNPYEPNPYQPPVQPHRPPPPPQPIYNDLGPARTVRVQQFAQSRINKLTNEVITVHANHQLVNEVILRASKNRIDILKVEAVLSNGQLIELPQARRSIKNEDLRVLVDGRYSLRIDRLYVTASSPNLVGSRAEITVYLGLAQ